MNPNDPIYPVNKRDGVKIFEANGLTTRDYIAIQMMAAVVARYGSYDSAPRDAYNLADSLIAESNKK